MATKLLSKLQPTRFVSLPSMTLYHQQRGVLAFVHDSLLYFHQPIHSCLEVYGTKSPEICAASPIEDPCLANKGQSFWVSNHAIYTWFRGNLWVLNFQSELLFKHVSRDVIDCLLVDEEDKEMYLWKQEKWAGVCKVYSLQGKIRRKLALNYKNNNPVVVKIKNQLFLTSPNTDRIFVFSSETGQFLTSWTFCQEHLDDLFENSHPRLFSYLDWIIIYDTLHHVILLYDRKGRLICTYFFSNQYWPREICVWGDRIYVHETLHDSLFRGEERKFFVLGYA